VSLDLFDSAIRNADAEVARQAAPDLPSGFSENFDTSLRLSTEWNNSNNYVHARQRALATYYDDVKARTGEGLPLYDMGGAVTLDELNAGISKVAEKNPEQGYLPLSEADIDTMTRRRMAKAHGDAAAINARERTWGGTFGNLAGGLVGVLSDPFQQATLPLGGAGTVGVALRALEFAAIAGGTQAGTAALSYSAREAAVPGSSREIPGEILGATLFGAGLGGAFGLLGKWLRAGEKPLPTSLREDVNAGASEAQFNAANVFPGAVGEAANRDAVTAAVQNVVKGEPVTAGGAFFEAYHGSPHDFEKFDVSKVISNMKGHGLFFSDGENYARNYSTLHGDGYLYKVRINADKGRFLDFDKNISDQSPFVQNALLQNADPKIAELAAKFNDRTFDFFDRLGGFDKAEASRILSDAGIQGTAYLHRPIEGGEGSRVFAVFDDKHIQITHKNGEPLTIAQAHAVEAEARLRPLTHDVVPDVERFDRVPGAAEDAASYWDRRLEGATPEERAALGASDVTADTAPSFTTARGSTYEVHPDGTTTRNKAARNDAGHEGDSGLKAQTEKTIYVDADVASALSGAGMSDVGGKGFRVVVGNGKATMVWWNKDKEQWGASDMSRDIPFTTAPELGKAPVELWRRTDDVPGREAYRGQHAGNAITEIRPARTSEVSAVRAPDLPPEQLAKMTADPEVDSAVLRNLDRIRLEMPDAEFTHAVLQPDGTTQLVTRKLEDVLNEIDGFEHAGKELLACATGMMAAE
jgi:hypothetical protein